MSLQVASFKSPHVDPSSCATLIAFSRKGGSTIDVNNTDGKLRNRPLGGLRLGSGFATTDDLRAEGGQIYDPKTGKTYSAAMALDGDTLRLRGFVGVKLFGKTESWKRLGEPSARCTINKKTSFTDPETSARWRNL